MSDVSRSIYRVRPSARPETIRARRKARGQPVAPGTEPPRETRRSMAVIVYGAVAAGGALVGLVAGWVLRGMW